MVLSEVTGSDAKAEAKEYYDRVVAVLEERQQGLSKVEDQLRELRQELVSAKLKSSKRMTGSALASGAAYSRKTKEQIAALDKKKLEILDSIEKAEERLGFAKEDLAEFE